MSSPVKDAIDMGAEGHLVGLPGFKPVVSVTSWQVGSIPMRSRQIPLKIRCF